MIIKENLQSIYNKLFVLLSRLKKMYVQRVGDIPTKIDRMLIGEDRMPLQIDGSVAYTINENELKYMTTIPEGMCTHHTGLVSVTIPDNINSIGNIAFSYCTSLENITIPDSVTSIGNSVFYGCTNLDNITIPDSVTSIGKLAFYGCRSLTDVYLKPTTPPSLGNTDAISTATTTIHVPIGSGDAYRNATNWATFADIIVEDIEI